MAKSLAEKKSIKTSSKTKPSVSAKKSLGIKKITTSDLKKKSLGIKIKTGTINEKSLEIKKIKTSAIREKSPAAKKIKTSAIKEKSPAAKKIKTSAIKEKSPAAKKIKTSAIKEKSPVAKKIKTSARTGKSPAAKKIKTIDVKKTSFKSKKLKKSKTADADKPEEEESAKTFEPGDMISHNVGPEHEENFRKFIIPQKHSLIKKLQRNDEAGVLVKHIPFGLTERNLASYFKQFGQVKQCRMPINPRNGRSKGFAFVHFDDADVARVAASTMNNYLILGNSLKCSLIPGNQMNENCYAAPDTKHHSRNNKAIAKVNKQKTENKEKKLLKKRNATALRALSGLGKCSLKSKDIGIC